MANSNICRSTIQPTSRPPQSAKTQRTRILHILVEACGRWVPSPEIAACAQQYNARLFELRKLGFCIKNRVDTDEQTGVRRSWFRLVKELPQSEAEPPKRASTSRDRPQVTTLPLFDFEKVPR